MGESGGFADACYTSDYYSAVISLLAKLVAHPSIDSREEIHSSSFNLPWLDSQRYLRERDFYRLRVFSSVLGFHRILATFSLARFRSPIPGGRKVGRHTIICPRVNVYAPHRKLDRISKTDELAARTKT